MPALVGSDSSTEKLSSVSRTVSPTTGTVTGRLVTPAGKLTVPEREVKSAGAAAVPGAVFHFTVTGVVLGLDRVTVNVAFTVPLSGSSTDASATEAEVLALPSWPSRVQPFRLE